MEHDKNHQRNHIFGLVGSLGIPQIPRSTSRVKPKSSEKVRESLGCSLLLRKPKEARKIKNKKKKEGKKKKKRKRPIISRSKTHISIAPRSLSLTPFKTAKSIISCGITAFSLSLSPTLVTDWLVAHAPRAPYSNRGALPTPLGKAPPAAKIFFGNRGPRLISRSVSASPRESSCARVEKHTSLLHFTVVAGEFIRECRLCLPFQRLSHPWLPARPSPRNVHRDPRPLVNSAPK